MSNTNKLISLLGTPFLKEKEINDYCDQELLEIYDDAFKNRVALLYLSKYRYEGWDERLEKKYKLLKLRENLTYEVISRIANILNKIDQKNYIIFKSIKPYPATPNDTDIIWLGDKKSYLEVNKMLLQNGYIFHEWAPQQRTYYDERGKQYIGKGKKGGTYYIDLYEEISTDYYAYGNKNNLKPFIKIKKVNEIDVNLLAPEPELAIMMFHNVFPEKTFQLEHFYVPLYYLAKDTFNVSSFISFVRQNKMEYAIKANLTLISILHTKYFGFVPEKFEMLLEEYGLIKHETKRFTMLGFNTPYMFSGVTFWYTFIRKTLDLYSFKSLLLQLFKMVNPIFFLDVLMSIKKRMSEKGTYHLE